MSRVSQDINRLIRKKHILYQNVKWNKGQHKYTNQFRTLKNTIQQTAGLQMINPNQSPTVYVFLRMTLIFYLHNSRSKDPWKLYRQMLSHVKNNWYVGINISQDINWNTHISKAQQMPTGIYVRSNEISNKAKENIWSIPNKSLVRLQSEHSSTVLSNAHIGQYSQTGNDPALHSQMDQKWQQKVLATDLLNKLGWMTLERKRLDANRSCNTRFAIVLFPFLSLI